MQNSPNTNLRKLPEQSIQYEVTCACLYTSWQTQSQHDPLLSYQHILLGVQQTHSTRLLNDCLAGGNGWQAVSAWLAHGYFQELAQSGVRTIAWVLPSPLAATSEVQHQLRTIRCLVVDTFTDSEAAYEWLCRW